MKQQVTVETILHTTLEIEGNSTRHINAKAESITRDFILSGNAKNKNIVENTITKLEVSHTADID